LIEPGRGDDNVDGGPGRNTISYDRLSAAVVVDLRTGLATGRGDEDTFVSITNALGTRFHSDLLIGDEQDNRLNGGGGPRDELIGGEGDDLLRAGDQVFRVLSPRNDDRLFGGAGDDQLDGNGGGDLLVGGPGRDRLRGQAGNDLLKARDGERDIVQGGRHRDRARVDNPSGDAVSGVEILF
jgi:Ca2+-binding RTX toxin-like protein